MMRRRKAATAAGHATLPGAASRLGREATFFGAVPDAASQPAATPRHDSSDWCRIAIAALRRRPVRLLPLTWRLRRSRTASTEEVIALLGSVEIRRVPAGCFVETCVTGEPDQARETALQRLAAYLNGDNRAALVLHAERPVIQQQVGPRRWRISVRLQLNGGSDAAPAPHAPKVKLSGAPCELLAVVRPGRQQTRSAVADGDTMVLDAVANSEWIVVGAPMLRLHEFGLLRRWVGGCEIGVPVAPRSRQPAASRNAAPLLEVHLPASYYG